MNRLEIATKITALEKKKEIVTRLKKDVNNYYTQDVTFSAQTTGTNFNKQYENEIVEVDKQIFIAYLMKEIDEIEDNVERLITELKVGY